MTVSQIVINIPPAVADYLSSYLDVFHPKVNSLVQKYGWTLTRFDIYSETIDTLTGEKEGIIVVNIQKDGTIPIILVALAIIAIAIVLYGFFRWRISAKDYETQQEITKTADTQSSTIDKLLAAAKDVEDRGGDPTELYEAISNLTGQDITGDTTTGSDVWGGIKDIMPYFILVAVIGMMKK